MEEHISRLKALKELAAMGGGEKQNEAQRAKGKLTARERIEALVDPGSFEEFQPLIQTSTRDFGMDKRRRPGDGLISGYARIDGRMAVVYAQDFTVMGGSIGPVHGRKMCNAVDWARKKGAPIISLMDSAGARIQEPWTGGRDGGSLFLPNTLASGVVPQLALILGPCAGISVYSPAIMDFIFMVDGISYMHITGPTVIESVTGEKFTSEELGGSRVHCQRTGCAHFRAPDELTCFARARELLSYLPQNHLEAPPRVDLGDDPDRIDEGIGALVPTDQRKPYDVREVIKRIADMGVFYEAQSEWASNVVVGFVRLNGESVGVVANQPMVMGGALSVDASDKCSRFIRFCDCFNIPLLFVMDVPGYLPGIDQEHAGIIRHGAKMLFAYCEASVPKITLTLRKGFGGGILAMGGNKGLGADFILAWPWAEMAVVGAEAAVDLLLRKQIKAADDPQAFREEQIKMYRDTYQNPYFSAETGAIDDILEPSHTRRTLIRHFEFLKGKREERPRKKHANIPL